MNLSITFINKAGAWDVHAVTASGVILALLVLFAPTDNKPQVCLLWLGLALLVDGLDDTLVCKYEVKEMLPHFGGSVLDLVIDYLTYMLIPTIFICRYIPLPEHFRLLAVDVVPVSSLFCFCNINMKSTDNYFVGFSAAQDVVAMYLYMLDLHPWVNLVTMLVLAVLTLTRMKFLRPFHMRQFTPLNIVVTFVWLISSGLLIVQQPADLPILLGLWFVASTYFAGICLWRNTRGWLG